MNASIDSRGVVAFLSRRQSYPESPASVEVVETHISWVFLTDGFAYKLKKPVRFEFLDFSTLELRRRACEDELRLNRRLAADVYLEVLPVTAAAGGMLSLDGAGELVDWVVKMRRLAADSNLERLIAAHSVTDAQVDRLASVLADFFAQLVPATVEVSEFRAAIERHVLANAADLAEPAHGLDCSQVQLVCDAHLRYLRVRADVFDARVRAGRVIEGHGDLRPEHVYFERGKPVIIDCVEFSRELRTLDVVDELSFLAIECERLGGAALGRRMLEMYQRQNCDAFPASLLAFYMSYRACVRAKIAALRLDQVSPAGRPVLQQMVHTYLELAARHTRCILPPLVLIVRGLMGSGKSTLAKQLSDVLRLKLLSTDAIRRESGSGAAAPAAYGEGIYRAAERRRIYEELLTEARCRLDDGESLVLDGTFLTDDLRRAAMAFSVGAFVLFVTCQCPAEAAQKRITARQAAGGSQSDARADLLVAQQAEDEPMAADLPHIDIDTTSEVSAQLRAVIDHIRAQLALAEG